MSLINVQNLSFTYEGGYAPVFENVNFQIDTDWKLGFVGRNGRGKTTFLNLLQGKYEYRGKISSSVKFTYFPFEVKDKNRYVWEILEGICPDAENWEIIREFSYLDLPAEILYCKYCELSGGEKSKVLLAGLFLNEGNFLLIDEPTNHLDATARQTVAKYLNRKNGFILVSHDRAFLDGCVDHILSVNKTDIEIRSGNFSSWFEEFRTRQAAEIAQNARLKKEINRLTESAERTSAWADKTEKSKYGKAESGLKQDKGYVGHKAAKLMKSAKVTEARRQNAAEQKSALLKNTEKSDKLKISPLEYRAEKLAIFCGAELFYGDKKVCGPINLEIKRGERIALEGRNGCGKSSLLKLIAGEQISFTGSAEIASGVKVSYVPQTYDNLRGGITEFAKEHGTDEPLFRAILSKMGFYGSDFDGDISSFSEGQKKKILIARSLSEQAHLYVWDEPLNYIDIYSRMQIENLLQEFNPTMIFVEHDRAFCENAATKIIKL